MAIQLKLFIHALLISASLAKPVSYLREKVSFKDKVILITEPSFGIASDAAYEFAKAGGKVALVSRDEQSLNLLIEQITKAGGTALKIIANVDKDSIKIMGEVINKFEKLDVLVNCPGLMGDTHSLLDANFDLFDKTISKNLRNAMVLSKHAAPHLKKTKGNIVNLSSMAALIALKDHSFNSIAHAAMDKFTDCAALEYGKMGIRVNTINPAIIRMEHPEAMGFDVAEYEAFKKQYSKAYPANRIGELYDTSAAILFLASDAASFITGTHLRVDGGAITAGAY